jgi:hypothetical protein
MATVNNIVIDQGTTFSFTFNLTNADGSAKDLSSYSVAAQVRKSYYTSTKVDFTTDKVDLEGEITISLTSTQTSNLKAGRYVYDIEIDDGSETIRVLEGIVTVTPEVTR